MIGGQQRFTAIQRLLHWLMAVCILAMLFIGVGMVSTFMAKYLDARLRSTSRLASQFWSHGTDPPGGAPARYGTPPLPADLPEPIKLAAHLSHYALYALMIAYAAARHRGCCRQPPTRSCCSGACIFPDDPAAERQPALPALERAFLSGFPVLCRDPDTSRGGVLPRARPTRRRVRGNGVGVDPRRRVMPAE